MFIHVFMYVWLYHVSYVGGVGSAAQVEISIYVYTYLFMYVIYVLLYHVWFVEAGLLLR